MEQPDGPVTRKEFFQEMGTLGQEMGTIRQEMGTFRQEMGTHRQEMSGMEDRLVERMRDMQTEMIKVFTNYQDQNSSRDTMHEKNTSALTERMGKLEDRVRLIESKLMLEPPAA